MTDLVGATKDHLSPPSTKDTLNKGHPLFFFYGGKNSTHPAAKSCVIKMPVEGERLRDA